MLEITFHINATTVVHYTTLTSDNLSFIRGFPRDVLRFLPLLYIQRLGNIERIHFSEEKHI